MSAATENTDLPRGNMIPGVHVKLDLSGAGVAADDSQKRAMLIGYRTSSGTAAPNTPVRYTSESDVVTAFGRGSDLHRLFRAFQSQIPTGAADIYCTGITAPAGTASVYDVILDFSAGATATGSGSIDVWFAGEKASASVALGATPATVVAALKTSADQLTNLPGTFSIVNGGAAASDTLRFTHRHAAVVGEDIPIRVSIQGSSTLRASPGWVAPGAGSATLVLATASEAAGFAQLNVGGTAISYTIGGVETVNAIAAGLTTAINAGAYPVTAVNTGAPSALVQLYYAPDRDVRRVTCRVVRTNLTANGTTVNAVAAGSYAYIGTSASAAPGSGTPTLTTALTNIGAQAGGFGTWLTSFNEATSLGTLATHIDAGTGMGGQADGYNQKGQMLHFGSAAALATAGAIITGASPALTGSPRYSLAWCVDSPMQAYQIAAHAAAVYCYQSYVAANVDGTVLTSRDASEPLMVPHANSRPTQDDQNAAMASYYMTPVIVNSNNQLVILRGVTTSNASNADYKEWAFVKQLDSGRVALRDRLVSLFKGKNFKANSSPKTVNTITTQSVTDAVFVLLSELDDQDLFDGAVAVKDAIKCNVNPVVRTRLDLFVPWSIMRAIHQIAPVMGPQ